MLNKIKTIKKKHTEMIDYLNVYEGVLHYSHLVKGQHHPGSPFTSYMLDQCVKANLVVSRLVSEYRRSGDKILMVEDFLRNNKYCRRMVYVNRAELLNRKIDFLLELCEDEE